MNMAAFETSLRRRLHRSPVLVRGLRRVESHVRRTNYDSLVNSLGIFAPASAGSYRALAPLTLLSAQQTPPLMAELAERACPEKATVVPMADFCNDPAGVERAAELKRLFDSYGSDKATYHDYHLLYGHILRHPGSIQKVLEIGLGTNTPEVVSTMGPDGHPGASLRAFRDFLPLASIFGADIDKTILFREERITTCFVDQTDRETFPGLSEMAGDELDLIIDDGLHAPNANLAVLHFSLDRLRLGGWLVVEDITPVSESIWKVVSVLMPENFRPVIVQAQGALMFAAQRVA